MNALTVLFGKKIRTEIVKKIFQDTLDNPRSTGTSGERIRDLCQWLHNRLIYNSEDIQHQIEVHF